MSFLSASGLTHASLATHVLSGNKTGYDNDWMDIPSTKVYTNVFILDEKEGKILLGFKKRGFGKGLYNGFGGKVEPGETIATAALRELEEEAGIRADIFHCGTLLFFAEGDSYAHLVQVFRAATPISGDPTESEEMRPAWYKLSPSNFCVASVTQQQHSDLNTKSAAQFKMNDLPSIPFDHMWADVPLWFPLMLSNQQFIGRVDFAKFTNEPKDAEMVKWWIGTIGPDGTRSTIESS